MAINLETFYGDILLFNIELLKFKRIIQGIIFPFVLKINNSLKTKK